MVIAKIFIGILMLVAGQRLFWLSIGALGFLAGYEFALTFSSGMPVWQVMVAGLVCGLLGVALAVFLEGAAIIYAGFLGGGYIFFSIWNIFQFGMTNFWWILFLASGIMGSVLLVVFFNPTLIIISSFIGAMLIAQGIPAEPAIKLILLIFLFIIGIFIQTNQSTAKSSKKSTKRKQ